MCCIVWPNTQNSKLQSIEMDCEKIFPKNCDIVGNISTVIYLLSTPVTRPRKNRESFTIKYGFRNVKRDFSTAKELKSFPRIFVESQHFGELLQYRTIHLQNIDT